MTTQLLVQAGVAEGMSPATRRRLRDLGLGAAGLITLGVVIQLLPTLGLVRSQDLPPTTTILGEFFRLLGSATLWQALYDTIYVWGLGLLVAVVAGAALGILIGSLSWVRNLTHSTIEFLRPIPSVALIPLVVLLFGTQYASALTLVIYASFWQVLVQTIYGVADVDPVATETARSYRFGLWTRIRWVILPTALPFIMTGVRLAATVALVLTVTAQLIIGTPGIGQMIALSENAGAVPQTYALVLITGLLGVIINVGARFLESRLLSWHMSFRQEALS